MQIKHLFPYSFTVLKRNYKQIAIFLKLILLL